MKKTILLYLCLIISVYASTETIKLSGEYSKELGNPFKKLLNKEKAETINIYSKDVDIILNVRSNLNTNNFYNKALHPDKIIIKNKTVENILIDYFSEEFQPKRDNTMDFVELNILSGTVNFSYSFTGNNSNRVNHIRESTVSLNVEIITHKNGKVTIQNETIKMDSKLGIEGDDYDWTITTSGNFNVKNINRIVQNIVEYQIYVTLSKSKKGILNEYLN